MSTTRRSVTARTTLVWCVALLGGAGGARAGEAQEPGSIVGRVLDAETREPVLGVEVALASGTVGTNASGGFLVPSVRAGAVTLTFRHVAYGEHTTVVQVVRGQERAIQVLLSPQAIELEAFEVSVESTLQARRNSSGHGLNEIGRPEILSAARSGMTLTDLLQTSMPGAIASRTSGSRTCVVYRPTGLGGDSNCRAVDVVLDGVLLADPGTVYDMIPLDDIERIEMMSPGQAATRYSTSSGQAVLMIETRTGTRAPSADTRRFVTGLHASEAGTHRTRSVFLSTLLTNTLLVGASLLAGDACFSAAGAAAYDLRTQCGGAATAAVGVFSIAAPAVVGSRVGRRVGETRRTRGRTTPAAVAAAIVLTSGYALVVRGGDASQAVGLALLGAGVPLTLTLSDRIFRELR
jgi:hypothetical protein